jgi:cell division protein FtsI (penicillin-binding protein 3)
VKVNYNIRFRVYVAFTLIALVGVLVLWKTLYIQVKEGPELRRMSEEMSTRTSILKAERGNIYTEKGELLCSSIPQFDIHLDFSVVQPDTFQKYVDTLSEGLARIFKDKPASDYRSELRQAFGKQSKYYTLRNNVAYYQYQALRALPIFNKPKNKGGFMEETKQKRVNPYGMLAYRTIGLWRGSDLNEQIYLLRKKIKQSPGQWLDTLIYNPRTGVYNPMGWTDARFAGLITEKIRALGLEAKYDSLLTGIDGWRIEQKASGGVWMPIEGSEEEPENGKDIVTTLDIGIQDVAEHALLSVLQKYECLNGTCVVMEVKTGKIRAIANLGRDLKTGNYYEDQNYALTRAEPGSTFKLATLTALLNDGLIHVTDNVDCNGGAKQFANRVMHDSHHGLGIMPIKKAFAQSSNVAMASLAYRFYYNKPEKFVAHLKQLHLNSKTGIDLLGENKPIMIEPEERTWSATTLPWMATGYGIMVTPLHTCMLYNALANNGRMMRPYLVSAVREYGKDIQTFEPQVLVAQIAPPEAIAQLKTCVEEVILSGTGKHIESPNYRIAGKTGTAQVADRIGGRMYSYKDGVYQGSFVGYFPADNPQYTMIVVIRTKPHSGAYYGGTIAAPVFRMVADKIFANGLGGWDGPLDSLAAIVQTDMPAKYATAHSYGVLLQTMGKKAMGSDTLSGSNLAIVAMDSSYQLHMANRTVYQNIVPNVTGLGLKDAVYLLETEGLKVQVQGSGAVQVQSLPPGSKIVKGQMIVLQLG